MNHNYSPHHDLRYCETSAEVANVLGDEMTNEQLRSTFQAATQFTEDPWIRRPSTISGASIRRLMRTYGVTVRELHDRTGLTFKRIREVRKHGICRRTVPLQVRWCAAQQCNRRERYRPVGQIYVREFVEMITGSDPYAPDPWRRTPC